MGTFCLCSREFMIAFLAEAYAPRGVRITGERFLERLLGERADMPAYIHHHDDIETACVICPSCVGLDMYLRDVEPHWSMAKIDFTYECADCGAEVRRTIVKPEVRH
jgi:hypothetical protein